MRWKYDKKNYRVPAPVADVIVTNPRTGDQQSVADCLVDTGSDVCWLRKSDIDELGITTNAIRFASVSGGPRESYGAHRLTLEIWGRTFDKVWVMALKPESMIGPVLGRDVINKLDLTFMGPDLGYEAADRSD